MLQQELDILVRAVVIVQRDVDASEVPAQIHLELVGKDGCRDAYHVALASGEFWAGTTGLSGEDESVSIYEVADGVQDLLAEVLRVPWPLCPWHQNVLRLGMLRADVEGQRPGREFPYWLCPASGGHVVSAVGSLHP
ncbi:hypothetical protein [Dactylosporangium salmoneum]|uniref:hypothetical protein n=1 Tax=Dactylosporangium salmoneum TaxID=53361 RepID=UPI0031D90722